MDKLEVKGKKNKTYLNKKRKNSPKIKKEKNNEENHKEKKDKVYNIKKEMKESKLKEITMKLKEEEENKPDNNNKEESIDNEEDFTKTYKKIKINDICNFYNKEEEEDIIASIKNQKIKSEYKILKNPLINKLEIITTNINQIIKNEILKENTSNIEKQQINMNQKENEEEKEKKEEQKIYEKIKNNSFNEINEIINEVKILLRALKEETEKNIKKEIIESENTTKNLVDKIIKNENKEEIEANKKEQTFNITMQIGKNIQNIIIENNEEKIKEIKTKLQKLEEVIKNHLKTFDLKELDLIVITEDNVIQLLEKCQCLDVLILYAYIDDNIYKIDKTKYKNIQSFIKEKRKDKNYVYLMYTYFRYKIEQYKNRLLETLKNIKEQLESK